MINPKNIIQIDGLGGLLVGTLLLLFQPILAELYHLPESIVLFIGLANLCYGAYSSTLYYFHFIKKRTVRFLYLMNGLWPFICVILLVQYRDIMSIFGWLHIAGEAIYVGMLSYLEYKWRDKIILY